MDSDFDGPLMARIRQNQSQRNSHATFTSMTLTVLCSHRCTAMQRGSALPSSWARYVSLAPTFVADHATIPVTVRAYVAHQLDVSATTEIAGYWASSTRFTHMRAIQQHYSYRDFHDQPHHFHLVRWLYTRAWLSSERPSMLFDLATARLVAHKILLPGVTTLVRLVTQVRDRAAQRLWQVLNVRLTSAQRAILDSLIVVPEGRRVSTLDRLRKAPSASLHLSSSARWSGSTTFARLARPWCSASEKYCIARAPVGKEDL
jgi:hypothetical protein